MIPLHGVRDQEKLQSLITSIEDNGWQGAPLVLWPIYGDLLTGSHRYAATQALGWDENDIPTISIYDVYEEAGLDFDAVLEEYDNPYWQEGAFIQVLEKLPYEIIEKYGLDMH